DQVRGSPRGPIEDVAQDLRRGRRHGLAPPLDGTTKEAVGSVSEIDAEAEVDRDGRDVRKEPEGRGEEREVHLGRVGRAVGDGHLELRDRAVVWEVPEAEAERQVEGQGPRNRRAAL